MSDRQYTLMVIVKDMLASGRRPWICFDGEKRSVVLGLDSETIARYVTNSLLNDKIERLGHPKSNFLPISCKTVLILQMSLDLGHKQLNS